MGDSDNKKVFLSWSGEKSGKIAGAFNKFLNLVGIKTFFSKNITTGERWRTEVAKELESSNFGLLFITKDNIDSPWIHFEAGALTKVVDNGKVCPILFEVDELETTSPLSQFQCIQYPKGNIKKFIHEINKACKGNDAEIVEELFEKFWPELSTSINKALIVKDVGNGIQYSEPFTIKVNKSKGYDREIQVRWLKDKPDGLEMTPSTFGEGVCFLHKQIECFQPALDPDLFVGIRNIGGAMASLIGGRIGGFKKPIMVVRVDPIADTSFDHISIEQCLFVGESECNCTCNEEIINNTLNDRIKRNRGRIKSILLFDQEIKSGSSLKSVIDYLKVEFPDAKNRIYSAVLVASKVDQAAEPELYSMLNKSAGFSIDREYLPDFLAFVNCGKRSKVYINHGPVH